MTLVWLLGLVMSGAAVPEQINPVPRVRLPEEEVARWEFQTSTEGWTAEHQCTVSAEQGTLRIRSTGEDPYLHRPVDIPGGEIVFRMRARCRGGGTGQVFWTTDRTPRRGEAQAKGFPLVHDGQWRQYEIVFQAAGRLKDLRLDPGTAPGEVDVDWIRLGRRELHPLEIVAVQAEGATARFWIKNHGSERLRFVAWGQEVAVPAGGVATLEMARAQRQALQAITLEAKVVGRDWPVVRRTVFLVNPEAEDDWIRRPLEAGELEVSRQGTIARLRLAGRVVGVLAPLVHCGGRLPALRLVKEEAVLQFEGAGLTLSLGCAGNEVLYSLAASEECEGPVVRAVGEFRGGVLAGLEYLGRNDASSSRLDVETEEHLRFAPDPLKVTFPLASLVTDRAALAMSWQDMGLVPTYATPNFFDGTRDHRMGLRGKRIEARVLVDRKTVEETIAWGVARHGLPPLPPAPRTAEQQWALCLRALEGPPLRSEAGWGHCAEPNWTRQPYADMASTIWRLTGRIVELPRLVPGGAHVANDAIYFVTGRAEQWKAYQQQQVAQLLAQQRPDGSYRYNGPFARGHFEDTASGVCARPAMVLLEYARWTGDAKAQEAGLRTLEYMKRFDVPRGAQVWEIPLHTPDQLASAYAVWAYVRGYELTGKTEYLAEARRWALSGIPFTYLWGRYPIMVYATPPVFGATHWKAPVWMGLPVQWVGGVYAYSLALLAPYDSSLDWKHLARGILICAEQQQYPDGPWAGMLPDSLVLASQQRNPPRINPCALVSLRLVLDGRLDSLCVAVAGKHRVVAPFPVRIAQGQAVIDGQKGLRYQILLDGRVVEVLSQGTDRVPLD